MNLEKEYPFVVSSRYIKPALPAQMIGHTSFEYIGPKIKTTIRSLGIQHFGVFVEPDDRLIAEFRSCYLDEAFCQAVELAEQRGLPWRCSGSADVFDPATRQRWSYHLAPASRRAA